MNTVEYNCITQFFSCTNNSSCVSELMAKLEKRQAAADQPPSEEED